MTLPEAEIHSGSGPVSQNLQNAMQYAACLRVSLQLIQLNKKYKTLNGIV